MLTVPVNDAAEVENVKPVYWVELFKYPAALPFSVPVLKLPIEVIKVFLANWGLTSVNSKPRSAIVVVEYATKKAVVKGENVFE